MTIINNNKNGSKSSTSHSGLNPLARTAGLPGILSPASCFIFTLFIKGLSPAARAGLTCPWQALPIPVPVYPHAALEAGCVPSHS